MTKLIMRKSIFWFFITVFILASCQKEVVEVEGNEPFSNFNISDLKIENYVNRLYIDIIGREPLDEESELDVDSLKASGLNRASRMRIIQKLMTDTSFREFEFSYKAAYVQNLYNLAKVRCLEGVADAEIIRRMGIAQNGAVRDSLEENWDAYYEKLNEIRRYQATLDSKEALRLGQIQYHQMFALMIDNGVYDQINMNTFNFVRAAYDELLWRLPTDQEFDRAFNMIEFNQPEEIFGRLGSDKNDFIRILTESHAMYEGMIIWAYQVLLNRPPDPNEVVTLLPIYLENQNINDVISEILVTDEYANFR